MLTKEAPPAICSSPDGYISVAQAALTYGLQRSTLYTWVRRGVLPAQRHGLNRIWILETRLRELAGYHDVVPTPRGPR